MSSSNEKSQYGVNFIVVMLCWHRNFCNLYARISYVCLTQAQGRF